MGWCVDYSVHGNAGWSFDDLTPRTGACESKLSGYGVKASGMPMVCLACSDEMEVVLPLDFIRT